MPKWIERWLTSRKGSHHLIAKLTQWQIRRQAKKDAKVALKAYRKYQSQHH